MSKVLVVGASRGLGAELAKQYAENGDIVFATARSDQAPTAASSSITYMPGIDVANEDAGSKIVSTIKGQSLQTITITAGYFAIESFDEPKWKDEIKMYTTSSIGPVFIVHHLVKAGLLSDGAKLILVSSESGSVTLRHASERGGNYGMPASSSRVNLLSHPTPITFPPLPLFLTHIACTVTKASHKS